MNNTENNLGDDSPLIGVLALQGAFQEHQDLLHGIGCRTRQVRTEREVPGLDGIILPGGESTAMGLIASPDLWPTLQSFIQSGKPVWGTCAGMILLADRCIGTSAVIEDGQSLIGGTDIIVCRNYFGSQISSFEMGTPPPPGHEASGDYPGVFIRAPAILSAGNEVEVLGRVVATPCRQAAVVLEELDRKIANGEKVIKLGVVDALDRSSGQAHFKANFGSDESAGAQEEKKDAAVDGSKIVLPGAAEGSNAREVICAVKKDNVLCTSFHPELTHDSRWHQYFLSLVQESKCQ